LEARSFVGGIRVRGVNTTGSSVTATYNLSVIASPETGIIPAQGTFPALDNPIAFDSRDDHRKIVITRAFRAGDGFDFTSNWQKIVFRGDEDILAQTKRVKVFIVLDNGYMFDSSTHYGRSQITIAGGEVI